MSNIPSKTESAALSAGQNEIILPSASRIGVAEELGVGKGDKRLNSHHQLLQRQMNKVKAEFTEIRSAFVNGVRHDYRRFGLLSEIVANTAVIVYDLPELIALCDTGFVDHSGKIYISAPFATRAMHEHQQGEHSLFFFLGHESDHLRRLHLERMLQYPHGIAVRAQDARINIDLVRAEAAERLYEAFGPRAGRKLDSSAIKALLNELSTTAVGIGIAMNYEDHERFADLSEESIAAIMMREHKPPPPIPNREISFPLIMEGAAGEVEQVKDMVRQGLPLPPSPPASEFTPAELSELARVLREVGQAKANPSKVSDAQLDACLQGLFKLKLHQGLLELDIRHERASVIAMSTGGTHSSGRAGDPYLDILKPHERIDLAINALKLALKPANAGEPRKQEQQGETIKDLERSLGRGKKSGEQQKPQPADQNGQKGKPSEGEPDSGNEAQDTAESNDAGAEEGRPSKSGKQQPGNPQPGSPKSGQGAGDAGSDAADSPDGTKGPVDGAGRGLDEQGLDMVPSPLSHSSDNHVIGTEQLIGVLRDAGVSEQSLQRLGFDDLKAIQADASATKNNLVAAINKASKDAEALGDRYPGAHLLNHAKAQLNDFFKPVLSWQMQYKKFVEGVGRGVIHDDTEGWTPFYVHHEDMGLESASDIPFLGSIVSGKAERPVLINIHDVSGSVGDATAKRFITEGVHQGRPSKLNSGIDSVHMTADTLVRNEPVFIDERNYQQILAKGISYEGRGGTNIQAVIEHALELVNPSAWPRKPYTGRKIAAITMFTDLEDAPPNPVQLLAKARKCGMAELPPILFLAPKFCRNERFVNAINKWASMVWIDVDKPSVVNIDKLAAEQTKQAQDWMPRALPQKR